MYLADVMKGGWGMGTRRWFRSMWAGLTLALLGCGGGAAESTPPATQGAAPTPAPTVNAPAPLGPVFPAAEPSGAFNFDLNCNANSAGLRTVAFGVPFPRGFLSDATKVRVETTAGAEVPIDVSELARWRHTSNTAIDGQSIRSVLITLRQTCAASTAYTYVLRWGTARTRTAGLGITASNVSTTWGPQAAPVSGEGAFTDNYSRDAAAPALTEPYAFATLPPGWLLKSNIRGPGSLITNTAMSSWLVGFNKTYVNDVAADVSTYQTASSDGLIDWNTETEGWLYDRPAVIWHTYFQTGDVAWVRHAHRASQYYNAFLVNGLFTKTNDPKYSYSAGLYAAYLLTGDARLLSAIRAIANQVPGALRTRMPTYATTSGVYTERSLYVVLGALACAYDATGDAAYRTQMLSLVANMQADVSNPPADYVGDRRTAITASGVLLHRPEVHEGDSYDDLIMSPWMSALMMTSLMHYHMLTDDQVPLRFMSNYAKFVVSKAIYFSTANQVWVPVYIAGYKAMHPLPDGGDDLQHAIDVMGLLAYGRWANTQLGLAADADVATAITRLRAATSLSLDGAVRTATGLPRYRATPTRRVGWWFANPSLQWLGVQ